jgi:hypothetical protein
MIAFIDDHRDVNPPPPEGVSSAPLNVIWSLANRNLISGYLLLRFGKFSLRDWPAVISAFVGFAAMSLMLANVFSEIPR